MTTYAQNFGGYTTGATPTGWTDRWDTDWTLTVRAGSDPDFGDKYLEINPGTTDAHRLFTYDAVDGDANRDDSEILIRYKNDLSYRNNTFGLTLRGSGSSASENGYRAYITGRQLYLSKLVSGTNTNLANTPVIYGWTDFTDYWHWTRFRVNGTSLKVKVWREYFAEPDAWTLEDTDSSVTGVGWAGIWNYDDFVAGLGFVDYFGVGTNGDTPALPQDTSGQVDVSQLSVDVFRGTGEARVNQLSVDLIRLSSVTAGAIETIMLESFEGYADLQNDPDEEGKWTFDSVSGTTSVARTGSNSLSMRVSTASGYLIKDLTHDYRMLVVGFALRLEQWPDGTSGSDHFLRLDSGTYLDGDAEAQMTLSINTAGKLTVYRGSASAGTLLETGATVLSLNTYHYIEFRVFIDDADGEYEVKINGATEVSDTSVDTQAVTGSDVISSLRFINADNATLESLYNNLDDIYIRGDQRVNTAGGFFGAVKIYSAFPSADGSHSQWSRSTGTVDFSLIDEVNLDTADYVYDSTDGNRVSVEVEDLPSVDSIACVQANFNLGINSGGGRSIIPLCRSNSTTYTEASQIVLSLGQYVVYETDPNTAAAWAEAAFNAAEFGLETD